MSSNLRTPSRFQRVTGPRAGVRLLERSAEGTILIPMFIGTTRFRDGGGTDRRVTLHHGTDGRGVEPHAPRKGAISLAGSGGPTPASPSLRKAGGTIPRPAGPTRFQGGGRTDCGFAFLDGRVRGSNPRLRIESARCCHYTNAPGHKKSRATQRGRPALVSRYFDQTLLVSAPPRRATILAATFSGRRTG